MGGGNSKAKAPAPAPKKANAVVSGKKHHKKAEAESATLATPKHGRGTEKAKPTHRNATPPTNKSSSKSDLRAKKKGAPKKKKTEEEEQSAATTPPELAAISNMADDPAEEQEKEETPAEEEEGENTNEEAGEEEEAADAEEDDEDEDEEAVADEEEEAAEQEEEPAEVEGGEGAEEEENGEGGDGEGVQALSQSMMQVSIHRKDPEGGGAQIEVRWAATAECDCQDKLSNSDIIFLVPSPLRGSWEDEGPSQQLTFVSASGQPEGSVVMELAGIAEPGSTYELRYVLESEDSANIGKSEPFSFTPKQLPKLTGAKKKAAKEKSEKANMASSMQHYAAEYKSKTEEVSWNPLLTITPQDSTWSKLLKETENKKQARVEEAQALSNEKQEAVCSSSQASGKTDELLDEAQLRSAVMAAFSETPGFIYAGAGVSMAAPSCSPSWWHLMNDLLAKTFARAPPEFDTAVAQLSAGDVSRQPEEIMESYYLVFKEHLFTLFGLLDKGEPNANHIGMAKLAKAGKVKAILTTNFDIFIERALTQEGVPFTVVVTSDEFEQYVKNGVDGVAVLKIHGTIDRPDTIVAVSNHYKMGKGFGGWKATATSHLMKTCPTLFLGYSGWDFQHKNYQEYWAAQSEVGGKPVFWLTLKAFPGGPDLQKLVGTHIGSRLRIGASSLPEFLVDILCKWDEGGMVDVTLVHENGASVKEGVEREREAFVKEWVGALPMVPVLTLLLMEAFTLNKKSQERMKRSKETGREAEAVGDTSEMSAYYMQLAGEMAAGKITMEEYQERLEASTLDLTLVHLQLPKATKEELKLLMVRATKKERCFQEGDDAAMLKSMLPSLVLSAGEALPYESTAHAVLDKTMAYIKTKVLPHAGKTDQRSKILKETYMYLPAPLKCEPAKEAEVCGMMDAFVDDGLKKKWDDATFNTERYNTLQKAIDQAITGYVDTGAVVDAQVKLAMAAAKKGDVDALLRDAMSLGLGLLRLVQMRSAELWESKRCSEVFAKFHGTKEEQNVPPSEFYAIEAELQMTIRLKPLKAAVEKVKKKGQRVADCNNVLAALDLAISRLWLEVWPYQGGCYQTTSSREHKGFYPASLWPEACKTFAKERMLRGLEVDAVTDERVLQPLLAAVATVGEASGDLALMEDACSRSLALTEGKVTELTPAPIPECLAAAYQAQGDYEAASRWYAKALDGLRTSVLRQKADAIVLNACLVQATIDKREALAWALKTSPFFGSAQQFSMVGPGRSLLVQQCEQWATELGYSSLGEAEAKVLSGE